MSDVKNPKVNEPNNPPIQLTDPNHDSCSVVNGPVINGVSSDTSSKRTGGNQPNTHP